MTWLWYDVNWDDFRLNHTQIVAITLAVTLCLLRENSPLAEQQQLQAFVCGYTGCVQAQYWELRAKHTVTVVECVKRKNINVSYKNMSDEPETEDEITQLKLYQSAIQ